MKKNVVFDIVFTRRRIKLNSFHKYAIQVTKNVIYNNLRHKIQSSIAITIEIITLMCT